MYTFDLNLEFDLIVHVPEGLRGTLDLLFHMGKNNTIQIPFMIITGDKGKPCPQSGSKMMDTSSPNRILSKS